MEPRNMAIGGIFADSKRLVVPIYQRTYEWTPERQIETLVDYIEAKAEARLAKEPAHFLHYMGALLLIPRSGFVFGSIPVEGKGYPGPHYEATDGLLPGSRAGRRDGKRNAAQ